jgi:hypothetical protein
MEDVARFGGDTGRLGVHWGDPECNMYGNLEWKMQGDLRKILRKIREDLEKIQGDLEEVQKDVGRVTRNI